MEYKEKSTRGQTACKVEWVALFFLHLGNNHVLMQNSKELVISETRNDWKEKHKRLLNSKMEMLMHIMRVSSCLPIHTSYLVNRSSGRELINWQMRLKEEKLQVLMC